MEDDIGDKGEFEVAKLDEIDAEEGEVAGTSELKGVVRESNVKTKFKFTFCCRLRFRFWCRLRFNIWFRLRFSF